MKEIRKKYKYDLFLDKQDKCGQGRTLVYL